MPTNSSLNDFQPSYHSCVTWKESKVSGGVARAGRRREKRGRGSESLTKVPDCPQKVL